MKIITWNCNMAYRKKASLILAHKPDIVVIPECEHPDKLKFESGIPLPDDVFWFGNNQNKGLGIFSYNKYKFQLSDIHNPDFRTILPLKVANNEFEFTLFAIWANNPKDKGFEYVGQIWKAINFYSELLKNKNTMLIGDFNSNTIWDKPKREGNHSTVVELLAKKGIHSTYHKFYDQTQGKEKHNTLFMYRHKDKPYHLDYCFASDDYIKKLINVEVGRHAKWCKHSDHTPLIVTFND
ncbi:MAG: endonuclease/exonuclease/phosphatase family protein [Bacteroidetes bacterium]|nr:MAG: endonuclease/exonuclease/phosphatase family protein [Bacteroidota bacterium]